METCMMTDFLESLKPWLSQDYIRTAYLNEEGHLVLLFKDNVKNVYNINDCSKMQLKNILADLKSKGIHVQDTSG
jgi:accessory colonization factor AcfC